MKNIIITESQLYGVQNLNEVDFRNLFSKIRKMVSSENDKLNREFAELLSKNFTGEFGKFLEKRLRKYAKEVDMIALFTKYMSKPDSISYENVFEVIGVPMLEFFLKKTFGKSSIKAGIRQITPFMKKVSTGNSRLDALIFKGFNTALKNRKVFDEIKVKLRDDIDDTLLRAISDKRFSEIIDIAYYDSEGQKKSSGKVDEGIGSVIGKGIRGTVRGVKGVADLFKSKEMRYKFKALDNVLNTLPKLNKSIKKEIRNSLFQMEYNDLLDLVDGVNTKTAARYVTIPIIRYIMNRSKDLYFKEPFFNEMADVMKSIFLSDYVVSSVQNYVEAAIKENLIANRKK